MSDGREPGRRFLAGRHAIEAFGRGGFRFGGMSHRGGILCLPSGVEAWAAPVPFRHEAGLYGAAFAESEAIDIMLVGCGDLPLPLPADLREEFRAAGMQVDTLTTAAAAGTFNVLLAEGRRVAAALAAIG